MSSNYWNGFSVYVFGVHGSSYSGNLGEAHVGNLNGVVRPKFLFKNSLFITKIIVELNFREINIIHVVLTKKNYHL